MVIPALSAVTPFLASGKLRALAVTSAHRSALLPDVPTVSEAGVPGYEATSWFGLSMPANAPPAVVAKLRTEVAAVLADPAAAAYFGKLGAEVATDATVPFPAYVSKEIDKWTKVAQEAGIKAE
jgi:tripartite-type tricarboxylate transporter receptor subunit TctC